jgi:DNA polymerase-3 subunit beta
MAIAQEVAMKFSIAQTQLQEALQVVSSAVPTRTTLPVLSNILVEADETSVRLTATDLDLAITTKTQANVSLPGSLTVPAKKLLELVRKLPREELRIDAKDLNLTIASKAGRFRFLCIRPDEFPATPTVPADAVITLDPDVLDRLVRRTVYAVSTDESRPALNGALMQVKDGELRVVATDGHRLARATYKPDRSIAPSLKNDVILPLKALNALSRLIPGASGPVEISLSRNHARFGLGGTTLITKLIEGPFPNYEQVIPMQNAKHLRAGREGLAAALERVSVFSDSLTRQVKLSLKENQLLLIVQTPDQGEATEELPVQYGAEDLDIGYNASYLLDILRTIETDEVEMQLNTPVTAGLVVPAGGAEPQAAKGKEDLLCLVMPLRLAS